MRRTLKKIEKGYIVLRVVWRGRGDHELLLVGFANRCCSARCINIGTDQY